MQHVEGLAPEKETEALAQLMIKKEEKEWRKIKIYGLTITPSFPHPPALLGEWGRMRSQKWRS